MHRRLTADEDALHWYRKLEEREVWKEYLEDTQRYDQELARMKEADPEKWKYLKI